MLKDKCVHPIIYLGGKIYGGSVYNLPQNMDHYFILEGKVRYKESSYMTFFPIVNMGVPLNMKVFHQCLTKAKLFLDQELSIFIGCISGHGRTGLFIVMLYYFMTKDKYSLYKVREMYCFRAVESIKQLKFLEMSGLFIKKDDYVKSFEKYYSFKKLKSAKV